MIIDSQNINFEEIVSNKQDLHFDYFGEFLKNNNIEINKNILKNFNMINLDDKYTNLGLLLSDECPYSIKCAIFEGKNDIKFKDRKEFSGCVIKQVNEVTDYLNIYNRISSEIIGLKRVDTRDYPEYALRESILNAVIHRDYNFTGSVLISLYDNHIEITSLGGLIKGLNIEDLYSGVSQTRNKNLANIFYRLKYVESFGTGIKRIIQCYENYNMKPELINTQNTFKVKMYFVNYKEENIISINLTQEEKIIDYLTKNNKINRKVIETILDVSSTRAKQVISNMIKKKIIIAKGKGKNTYYILK